jgi:hypothetical protein
MPKSALEVPCSGGARRVRLVGACARSAIFRGEAIVRIRFVGIDPGTGGNNCPAVFVDEDTGDFLFQGDRVTDPGALAEVAKHSPIGATEAVVKLPSRMAAIILEALNGSNP